MPTQQAIGAFYMKTGNAKKRPPSPFLYWHSAAAHICDSDGSIDFFSCHWHCNMLIVRHCEDQFMMRFCFVAPLTNAMSVLSDQQDGLVSWSCAKVFASN